MTVIIVSPDLRYVLRPDVLHIVPHLLDRVQNTAVWRQEEHPDIVLRQILGHISTVVGCMVVGYQHEFDVFVWSVSDQLSDES